MRSVIWFGAFLIAEAINPEIAATMGTLGESIGGSPFVLLILFTLWDISELINRAAKKT